MVGIARRMASRTTSTNAIPVARVTTRMVVFPVPIRVDRLRVADLAATRRERRLPVQGLAVIRQEADLLAIRRAPLLHRRRTRQSRQRPAMPARRRLPGSGRTNTIDAPARSLD